MATAITTAIPPAGDASTILIKVTMTNNSITLTLSGGTPGEGASIAYYRISFNHGERKRVSNPVTFTGLSPETSYSFVVDFVDNYGTVALGKKDMTVITDRYSVDDANNINVSTSSTSDSITISLSGGTPVNGTSIAYYRIAFDYEGWKRVSNPATFTGLSPNKTYHFYVGFVDSDGYIARGNIVHSATTKNSSVSDANNINISVSSTNTSATIYLSGGTPADGASIAYYRISFNHGGYYQVSNPVTFTDLSPGTTYYFNVDFIDSNGNIASGSTAGSVTTTNSSPPTKGSVSVSNITYNGARFTWSGFSFGAGATWGKYQYKCQDQDWIDCGTNTSITITDRNPNTSNTFYVRLVDNYGQASDSATVSFTTTKPATSDANNINISVSSTNTSATIYLSGGTPADGASIAYYRISFGGGGYYQVSNPVTFTDLSPGTTYRFSVDFIDSYGNIASGSTAGSVTTKNSSAPTKGSVSASNITYNGAKLSWSGFSFGSGATWGKYQYSWNNSNWTDCGQSTNLTFTDRSPNTTYNFYVRLVDNYGQASAVASTSFTTSKPSAPSKGTVTVGNITESSAVFSWSGFEFGAGATWGYYRYSTNGSNWTSCGTDVMATLTGLSANTSYTFYVQLVDNYGTTSSSATVTFKTEVVKAWKYGKYGIVYIKVNDTWKYGKLYYKKD